jgi:polo-like kinase 1
LQTNPDSRPTAKSLASHPFLALGRKKPSPLHAILGISASETQLDVADIPSTSIVKYTDQHDKLGFGYLLLNGTIGAILPDGSRLVMDPHQEFLQYWADPTSADPETLTLPASLGLKKVATLLKFERAFSSAARSVPATQFARDIPMVHVKTWTRGSEGILFCMSDENVQLNFADKQKLLLLRQEKQVMLLHNFTDKAPVMPLSEIQEHSLVGQRLRVAKEMLRQLDSHRHGSRKTL